MEDCIEATGLTFKAVISGETFRGSSLELGQAPHSCLISVFKGKACETSRGGRAMSWFHELETSICPHFKGVVMPTKSSRPETWENLGLGEGRHLLHSVPTSRGRKGTTLPAALTSMPLHTKKEGGGLMPASHAQTPSRVCTQNTTGRIRRPGQSFGR